MIHNTGFSSASPVQFVFSSKTLVPGITLFSQNLSVASFSPPPPVPVVSITSSWLWAEGKTLGMHTPKTKKSKMLGKSFFQVHFVAWCCECRSNYVAVLRNCDADPCFLRMILKTDCGWHRTKDRFKLCFQRWNSSFPEVLSWLILGYVRTWYTS